MKLLFLLVFSPVVLAHCPVDYYKDDVFKKCRQCTPCHVTLTPCSANKDAVCKSFSDGSESNHHFTKSRIHFFDDAVDGSEEDGFHERNFIPHEKDHHKKNAKHIKTKHDEKYHHKKKHYEFDDDDDDDDDDGDDDVDDYYDDDFDYKYEKLEKPKKHKKHFEFNKKHYKKKSGNSFLSNEEVENEKLHFILGKESHDTKKKLSHPKKIDIDEEELEQWLLQSQQKLKIRKDNLLKTLKDEKVAEKSDSKVRLNSPVLDLEDDESYDVPNKLTSKRKSSNVDALKALADLNDDDSDDEDFDSFLSSSEESYKPVPPPMKPKRKPSSEIIGQGKEVDDMLRSEMGKNVLFEKPHFKVVPFVVGKDFNTEKKKYSPKYQPASLRQPEVWDDEKDSEEYREIKTNDVVSLPFTAAETLVWDWQAVAVASAVASCLVFFLVVAIYFIVNTRHWKSTHKTYNKEMEEVSTRIALMHPMLELGSPDSHSYLYMESISSPVKEDEKKHDMKV